MIEVEIRGRMNKRSQEGHSQVLELVESQDEKSRDTMPPSLRPGSLWPGRGRPQKETLGRAQNQWGGKTHEVSLCKDLLSQSPMCQLMLASLHQH